MSSKDDNAPRPDGWHLVSPDEVIENLTSQLLKAEEAKKELGVFILHLQEFIEFKGLQGEFMEWKEKEGKW